MKAFKAMENLPTVCVYLCNHIQDSFVIEQILADMAKKGHLQLAQLKGVQHICETQGHAAIDFGRILMYINYKEQEAV